jgi:hypothetical protein
MYGARIPETLLRRSVKEAEGIHVPALLLLNTCPIQFLPLSLWSEIRIQLLSRLFGLPELITKVVEIGC